MKLCPVCNIEFEITSTRHKHQKYCSLRCCRKQYRLDHPEKIKQFKDKYKEKNPNANKQATVKWKYGLTSEEHQNLLEKADHCCMVCKKTDRLCVDHNHSTGEVRGILCHKCNSALGLLGEDVEIMKSLIKYTEE